MECPCGSSVAYTNCCQPYVEFGHAAETPERLLRLRYAAYTMGRLDVIEATMDPSRVRDYDAESTRQWLSETSWLGLEIGPEVLHEDGRTITFQTRFENRGQVFKMDETSLFMKAGETWRYAGPVQ